MFCSESFVVVIVVVVVILVIVVVVVVKFLKAMLENISVQSEFRRRRYN